MTEQEYVATRAIINKRIWIAVRYMRAWRRKGYHGLASYFETIKDDLERRRDQIDAQFIWKQ